MASSSRMRQTVVRPMGLFSSSAARLAKSVVDCRLNGLPVRATTSQAMDATMALSRGGKGRLAASPGSVLEGKLALGPALPPTADAVGMEVESASDFDMGKRGMFVEKQDQVRPLPKVRPGRARGRESSSLGEERIGKARAIAWCRSRHETAPWASSHSSHPGPFGNLTRI